MFGFRPRWRTGQILFKPISMIQQWCPSRCGRRCASGQHNASIFRERKAKILRTKLDRELRHGVQAEKNSIWSNSTRDQSISISLVICSRAQPLCSSERCATSRETIPCRACAVQNGTDLVQADKHDLIMVSISIWKEMCIRTLQSEHLSRKKNQDIENEA